MATQVVEAAADPAKAEAFVGKVLSDTTGFASEPIGAENW
jgi:hypothetical protein